VVVMPMGLLGVRIASYILLIMWRISKAYLHNYYEEIMCVKVSNDSFLCDGPECVRFLS
jgi:hypothetical protein